jgi:hypothetical protein
MDQSKTKNPFQVEKFSHDLEKPRAERWRDWIQKLKFAFGASFPALTNQISEKVDYQEHWWGLVWNEQLFVFDNMTPSEERQLYLEFIKAQNAIMSVLSSNFGTHEKQTIADHDPVALTAKMVKLHPAEWDDRLTFFPSKIRLDPHQVDDNVDAFWVHVSSCYLPEVR